MNAAARATGRFCAGEAKKMFAFEQQLCLLAGKCGEPFWFYV
jgi:hypothetical protein